MPCIRCGAEFGIFKKESYCRNCGFSYCSSCLTKKIVIPKLGNDSKHAVCHKCFAQLSSSSDQSGANVERNPPSPPAALQKRLDAANAASGHAHHRTTAGAKPSGATNVDSYLAARLENLRAERRQGPVPSLSQLEERLARLKGNEVEGGVSASGRKNRQHPPSEATSSVDHVQHLFQQVADEVKMDSALPRPEDEIRARLDRLHATDESLNDLNKLTVNGSNNNGVKLPPSLPPPPPQSAYSEFNGSAAIDPEVFEVWQYMVKAEEEARHEAEDVLRLQERDQELRMKLEEIRANRDVAKRTSGSKLSVGDLSDEDNEDKLSDKVIHQFLNEARLEADSSGILSATLRTSDNGPRRLTERKLINSSDREDSDDCEELPWCTICNEDASLRCYGCEGDLYCRRCFRECHNTQELKDHPSALYTPKMRNGH